MLSFYFLFSPVFCEHPEKAEHTKLVRHAVCEDSSRFYKASPILNEKVQRGSGRDAC